MAPRTLPFVVAGRRRRGFLFERKRHTTHAVDYNQKVFFLVSDSVALAKRFVPAPYRADPFVISRGKTLGGDQD